MTLSYYLPCFMSTLKCHFNEIIQTNKVDSPTPTFHQKIYLKSINIKTLNLDILH